MKLVAKWGRDAIFAINKKETIHNASGSEPSILKLPAPLDT